ncbi:MAG: S8 family serine peptidase [Halospina sp.]
MPDQDNDVMQAPRVILRFEDEVVAQRPDNPVDLLAKSHPARWRAFQERYGDVRLSRSLTRIEPDEIAELQKRALERDPTYRPANFEAFFDITTEKAESLEEMAKALRGWPGIRSVDIEVIGPDPLVVPADDPRFANQGYLTAAPDGIDAPFAWVLPGGDGAGQRVIDVERGWTTNHDDLVAQGATLIHGTIRDGSRAHGTSVLGEIVAVDNTIGCVGIAPNVAGVMCSSYFGSTQPDAILAAAAALSFGDTILLEVQVAAQYTPSGDPTYGPTETIDLNFEAIRLATALGMIVIEAGGNGTNNGGLPALDLDAYTKGGQQILNPGSADFRDSGAIIVAAASSAAPHTRMNWSTFGARIDCFAWGQNVNTTSSSAAGATDLYTTSFGGTSSASPIVTGAALCVQGVFEAQNGFRLSPGQMRILLSDPSVNTNPAATETTAMGVMPNLAGIIGTLLQLTPDVYIRDFTGDTGEPHGGPISASPDIIVRKTAVANPQAAFGQGSGTEMMDTLGHTVEAGQDNFIYVRALNQGNAAATGTTATIYWSPPSTLLTPDLWTLVGTVPMPLIPVGETLVCADALTWPSGAIPGTGHYCFVGLLDHPQDSAPPLGLFSDWDNFRTFIRSNNNVTWRNFNVVDVDPAAPAVDPLAFMVAGWIEKALAMAVEMRLKLPRGAEVMLELPLRFLRDLQADLPVVKLDRRRMLAYVRLPASGRVLLGRGDIAARAQYRMRLMVDLPVGGEGRLGQVIVRQLYRGEEEVGRVTWEFHDIRLRKEIDERIARAG